MSIKTIFNKILPALSTPGWAFLCMYIAFTYTSLQAQPHKGKATAAVLDTIEIIQSGQACRGCIEHLERELFSQFNREKVYLRIMLEAPNNVLIRFERKHKCTLFLHADTLIFTEGSNSAGSYATSFQQTSCNYKEGITLNIITAAGRYTFKDADIFASMQMTKTIKKLLRKIANERPSPIASSLARNKVQRS